MHLGLIGGIGPAATEFYYRGLVQAFSSAGHILDLTIVNADTNTLLNNLARAAADEQAQIFLTLVERLQAAGADVAAVTSLAGHFCIQQLEARSPLPLINALPVLDRHFDEKAYRRIALLGTRSVMESSLYGQIHSAEVVQMTDTELDQVHEDYVTMAKAGKATDEQSQRFLMMAGKLCRERGADAVALAGTDLFLAFNGVECDFPVVDCARVHINELARIALENKPEE